MATKKQSGRKKEDKVETASREEGFDSEITQLFHNVYSALEELHNGLEEKGLMVEEFSSETRDSFRSSRAEKRPDLRRRENLALRQNFPKEPDLPEEAKYRADGEPDRRFKEFRGNEE